MHGLSLLIFLSLHSNEESAPPGNGQLSLVHRWQQKAKQKTKREREKVLIVRSFYSD